MRFSVLIRLCPVLVAALCGQARAQPVVSLASLEWPPYAGAQLPERGLSTATLARIFQAAGFTLEVKFYPWARAVAAARHKPAVMGYFPEYDAAEVRRHFICSDPIGHGPLGLAQRKAQRLRWREVSDLAAYRVGVVQDYVNNYQLDRNIAEDRQRFDPAPDDGRNLLKLASGSIDLAVIDQNVFHYLLRHDSLVRHIGQRLEMNPRLLETKTLHVCFKPGRDGERLAAIVNRGLKILRQDAR